MPDSPRSHRALEHPHSASSVREGPSHTPVGHALRRCGRGLRLGPPRRSLQRGPAKGLPIPCLSLRRQSLHA
eukprot:7294215-Heterocapsa_arctica.AAC.1